MGFCRVVDHPTRLDYVCFQLWIRGIPAHLAMKHPIFRDRLAPGQVQVHVITQYRLFALMEEHLVEPPIDSANLFVVPVSTLPPLPRHVIARVLDEYYHIDDILARQVISHAKLGNSTRKLLEEELMRYVRRATLMHDMASLHAPDDTATTGISRGSGLSSADLAPLGRPVAGTTRDGALGSGGGGGSFASGLLFQLSFGLLGAAGARTSAIDIKTHSDQILAVAQTVLRRQLENFKRVTKAIDTTGPFPEKIKSSYCLGDALVNRYACIIFARYHRIDVGAPPVGQMFQFADSLSHQFAITSVEAPAPRPPAPQSFEEMRAQERAAMAAAAPADLGSMSAAPLLGVTSASVGMAFHSTERMSSLTHGGMSSESSLSTLQAYSSTGADGHSSPVAASRSGSAFRSPVTVAASTNSNISSVVTTRSRRLWQVPFTDIEHCLVAVMAGWTDGTHAHFRRDPAFSPELPLVTACVSVKIDPLFVEAAASLRGAAYTVEFDRLRDALQMALEQELGRPSGSLRAFLRRFLPNLLSLASHLLAERTFRQVLLDILERVVDPLRRGCAPTGRRGLASPAAGGTGGTFAGNSPSMQQLHQQSQHGTASTMSVATGGNGAGPPGGGGVTPSPSLRQMSHLSAGSEGQHSATGTISPSPSPNRNASRPPSAILSARPPGASQPSASGGEAADFAAGAAVAASAPATPAVAIGTAPLAMDASPMGEAQALPLPSDAGSTAATTAAAAAAGSSSSSSGGSQTAALNQLPALTRDDARVFFRLLRQHLLDWQQAQAESLTGGNRGGAGMSEGHLPSAAARQASSSQPAPPQQQQQQQHPGQGQPSTFAAMHQFLDVVARVADRLYHVP
ncbi:hypothetical protein H696_01584 [Fonticula alba]|uniref:Uncharacterized protein n=1 Tax=Fonticula alba TaxID=691883 RepID=A0A058ZFC7_FONAL|nr:hypothetical protein H696_01584 [Fonticula alba]KCV72182.1 hypothetical protein H696_01584 [Fonticula alba]|eukprot:XP_009493760.1 hypothetical protein H696_01584 [Fonticula alba]